MWISADQDAYERLGRALIIEGTARVSQTF
jgi:hypothetical protein